MFFLVSDWEANSCVRILILEMAYLLAIETSRKSWFPKMIFESLALLISTSRFLVDWMLSCKSIPHHMPPLEEILHHLGCIKPM